MNLVEITVCIANWNCRKMLYDCLRSLLEQPQGASLEVIVVDNASCDGAPDMVARYFPQVRLIRNAKNTGFSHANNQAARVAQGRYLFFLNNDTIVPAWTLGRLRDHLALHPDAMLVGPRLRDGQGRVQTSFRRRPTVGTFLHRTLLLRWTGLFRRDYMDYRRKDVEPERARSVDVLMGAAIMMRRPDFVALGGWDEDYTFGGEDLDLCRRAACQGKVVYLPSVEITHFGRSSTKENLAFASTHIAAGFAKYFRKSGAPRWQMLAYKTAVTLDAPVQLVVKGAQYLFRRLRGKKQQAQQSLRAASAAVPFLAGGWWKLWRA